MHLYTYNVVEPNALDKSRSRAFAATEEGQGEIMLSPVKLLLLYRQAVQSIVRIFRHFWVSLTAYLAKNT